MTSEVDVERLTLEPIGIIPSEHQEPEKTPIEPVCAECSPGRVEVFPQYAEGGRRNAMSKGGSHAWFRQNGTPRRLRAASSRTEDAAPGVSL